jgi:alkylation response protein AidB-like acyl-CoA dehydrogenase
VRHIFDIDRTVRTYGLYFDEHADVLRELLQTVSRSLDRLLPPEVARAIDREGSTLERSPDGALVVRRHPRLDAALEEMCRLGLFRTFAPEAHGGFDLPVAIYYLAVQLISYYDTSLALVFLVHGNAMYVIERYGTEEQRRRYLPSMASGERLASVSFTEPTAGSDAGSIRTRATRDERGYVLSGSKLFITNGGDAEILVTTARTGPVEDGIHGVSAFIVEREEDGVEVVGLEEKTGLGGSPTAALSYPEVRIPADRLLGRENRGGEVMFAGVGMTRVNIGAQALGIAKRAFDAAVSFALQREQGGCLIAEHDAIQQRLADMVSCISTMENMICWVSSLEQRRLWHVREMSVTKYFCSEALQELTLRAVGVHGGYGVSKHYEVERCRREAAALPLYGGTSEIQWLIISRELVDSLSGEGHADYRARDRVMGLELQSRCQGSVLPTLTRRVSAVQERMWAAVERVAGLPDPVPFHRHLAELATALAATQVLLWQASAGSAGTLERELAAVAVDRLEDRATRSCARIDGQLTRGVLKSEVRGLI